MHALEMTVMCKCVLKICIVSSHSPLSLLEVFKFCAPVGYGRMSLGTVIRTAAAGDERTHFGSANKLVK